MTRYLVYLRTVASTTIPVEADSPEQAIDEAFGHIPSLCAQCSGWGQDAGIELGEWEPNDQPWPAYPGDVAVEEDDRG